MVCIAAFIILCILSIFVAILSIFRRDLGKKYLKVFKKSWGCVGKKLTLQKCETNFKEDIKNSILKKVVVKRPHLVKPISVAIEVAAVLIVVITIWSLVTAVKSGLSLWALGTCDIVHPSACTLGSEVCSIDSEEPQNFFESIGRWFTDWGEIFSAIPDKFRSWDASEFDFTTISTFGNDRAIDAPTAIDIIDPGCLVCLQSYKNQQESGFFSQYNVTIVPFPIQGSDGVYKYANSDLIVRYILATAQVGAPSGEASPLPEDASDAARTTAEIAKEYPAQAILNRIFTEYNEDHVIYQTVFNEYLDASEAEAMLQDWLSDWGYDETSLNQIIELSDSDEIKSQIAKNKDIVENQIHAKGIPTMIYDNAKHTGRYEANWINNISEYETRETY